MHELVYGYHKEFVGGLSENTEDSQEAFKEKSVPYKIDKCRSNHNSKLQPIS